MCRMRSNIINNTMTDFLMKCISWRYIKWRKDYFFHLNSSPPALVWTPLLRFGSLFQLEHDMQEVKIHSCDLLQILGDSPKRNTRIYKTLVSLAYERANKILPAKWSVCTELCQAFLYLLSSLQAQFCQNSDNYLLPMLIPTVYGD